MIPDSVVLSPLLAVAESLVAVLRVQLDLAECPDERETDAAEALWQVTMNRLAEVASYAEACGLPPPPEAVQRRGRRHVRS